MGAAGSCAKDRKPPGFKKLEEGLSHLELPKLSNPFDKSEKTEGDKYIDSLEQYVDKNYPFLDKCTDVANPVIKVLVRLVCCVAPLYKFLFQAIYIFYKWAPKCLLQMAIGLSLCFFGGQYLMVLAAIEAWNNTGGKDTMNNLKIVFEEGQAMLKNQRAPTSFVPPGEALQQSTIVALKSVKDPKRLEVAVGGLWSSYLAVIATLRMQFARTVALALGIADNIKKPLTKAITPALEHLTGLADRREPLHVSCGPVQGTPPALIFARQGLFQAVAFPRLCEDRVQGQVGASGHRLEGSTLQRGAGGGARVVLSVVG